MIPPTAILVFKMTEMIWSNSGEPVDRNSNISVEFFIMDLPWRLWVSQPLDEKYAPTTM